MDHLYFWIKIMEFGRLLGILSFLPSLVQRNNHPPISLIDIHPGTNINIQLDYRWEQCMVVGIPLISSLNLSLSIEIIKYTYYFLTLIPERTRNDATQRSRSTLIGRRRRIKKYLEKEQYGGQYCLMLHQIRPVFYSVHPFFILFVVVLVGKIKITRETCDKIFPFLYSI